jgi:hypothetical protein
VTPAARPAPGSPAPGSPAPGRTDRDAQRWQQAAQLRAEHKRWIIVWLAPENCFRAYRRMPGARRDTALSAATSAEMASLIAQAEQVARAPASGKEGS